MTKITSDHLVRVDRQHEKIELLLLGAPFPSSPSIVPRFKRRRQGYVLLVDKPPELP